MNERDQDGQTRLEVAKTVTTRLVTETLPPGVPMVLRTCSGGSVITFDSGGDVITPDSGGAIGATLRMTRGGRPPVVAQRRHQSVVSDPTERRW